MDTSDTEQYIYSCDVQTSSVTYKTDTDTDTDEASETDKMWDDEPPAWGDDAPAEGAAPAEGEEGAPADAFEGPPPILLADREKAPKPEYTLHWVRPLFLNYDYLYDYRQNYYNDYIDYLDRRQRGIWREVPRAQEWAERTLRTYVSKNKNKSGKRSADMRLMNQFGTPPSTFSLTPHSYHTRAYYSLKYQKIF